ncbi:MAG: transposase [Chloroflexota bacterium]
MVRFELGLLHQIGRLTVAPSEMLGQLSLRLGMRELTQPLSALIDVADMITWTRDPFDRLIVAGAQLADATLVTKDHAIRTHFRGAVWD